MKTCPTCEGTGHVPDPDSPYDCHALVCPTCDGTGEVADDFVLPPEDTPTPGA